MQGKARVGRLVALLSLAAGEVRALPLPTAVEANEPGPLGSVEALRERLPMHPWRLQVSSEGRRGSWREGEALFRPDGSFAFSDEAVDGPVGRWRVEERAGRCRLVLEHPRLWDRLEAEWVDDEAGELRFELDAEGLAAAEFARLRRHGAAPIEAFGNGEGAFVGEFRGAVLELGEAR